LSFEVATTNPNPEIWPLEQIIAIGSRLESPNFGRLAGIGSPNLGTSLCLPFKNSCIPGTLKITYGYEK
jgi:hypothetical protein